MLFLSSIVFCQKYNMSKMLPQHVRQFFPQISIFHSSHTVWCTFRLCILLLLQYLKYVMPSRLRLRSSNSDQLMAPSYNLTTVGRRAFPVFAANLWNSLPANLTSAPSLTIFRQRLQTHLFRRSYPDLII